MPGLFQFAIPGNIKRVTSQKSEQMAGTLSLAQHPCSKITSDFFFLIPRGKQTHGFTTRMGCLPEIHNV